MPPDTWVVVASDGFTNFVGPTYRRACPVRLIRYAPRAGDTAVTLAVRAIIDCANASGAGDNIAVAVAVAAPCET